MSGHLWEKSSLLILGFGVSLFVVAVGHHTGEFLDANYVVGPLVALFFEGLLALGLVYAGYRLSRGEFAPREQLTIAIWCFGGSALFGTMIGVTFIIRLTEGRVVTEPLFPLLIALETGAAAGVVAGYYNARARADARQARTVSDALAFVNDLIRHDLRNDLNVISGHAELIASEHGDAAFESGATPTVIAEKADEALTRIETTRAIAEVLVGEPNFERVDLASMSAELAAQVENSFSVTVRTDLPDQACVTANAGLQSVVDNLLENAVEHNDAENPQIEVAVETTPETVRLTVRDNGPGIPDQQKRTLLTAQESGGSGLTLVQTLVDAYGGELRIEDNDPRGSAFVVTLPRATCE